MTRKGIIIGDEVVAQLLPSAISIVALRVLELSLKVVNDYSALRDDTEALSKLVLFHELSSAFLKPSLHLLTGS